MKCLTLMIGAAGLVATLSAQPSTSDVQTYLSLTDAQVQSLQQLRTQQRQALQSTFQQIRQKQQDLQNQLSSGSTDAAALGQLLVDIQTLKKSISTAQSSYNTQALAVLTADQKTKLQTLQSAAALRPQISEATALGLLTPPSGGAGSRMGMGPGPGMMFHRGGGPRAGWRGGRRAAPPEQQF